MTKTAHVPRRSLKDILRSYACVECDARPPRGDYMVHDAVWSKAGMSRHGFLCLSCLEKRLIAAGHGPLCLDDFIDAPCNAGIRFGYAMARRAAGNAETPDKP